MKKVMIVFPHADDLTLSVGGTVCKWAGEGREIVAVRITNDDADCAGIPTREEAVRINREECENAYAILGIKKVIHLGYTSDTFAAINFLELREKLIRLIREERPDTTVTFSLDGKGEENMDHRITAYAMCEAHWTASFDLHHPEHLHEGFKPFCVPERLYFARYPRLLV